MICVSLKKTPSIRPSVNNRVLVHGSKYDPNTTDTVSTHTNTKFSEESHPILDQSGVITLTAWRQSRTRKHWRATVCGLAGRRSGSASKPSQDTRSQRSLVKRRHDHNRESLCGLWIRTVPFPWPRTQGLHQHTQWTSLASRLKYKS